MLVLLGVAIGFVGLFLFVAAPNWGGPMFPSPWEGAASIVGLAGLALGNVWLIRIHRANRDPDTARWRYRDR